MHNLPNTFNTPTLAPPTRLVLAVDGLEKSGKTHFALTAPGPIALFDLDKRLEGVIHKFPDKEILTAQYNTDIYELLGEDDDELDYKRKERWQEIKTDYMNTLASSDVRTVVVDTGTKLFEIARLAHFGKLTQVLPKNYSAVNSEFEDLLNKAKESTKNVILLHQLKDVWSGNTRLPGEYKRAGWSGTGYITHANLRTWYDEEEREFSIEVVSNGFDMDMSGETYPPPLNTFSSIAAILTGTDEDTWR